MLAIIAFFLAHWYLSVFCQTFFQHRYGAHRMFNMSPFWERFFHLLTYLSQGSSYLDPRAYAILHREHHAYSDTERDPHSPHFYPNVFLMMVKTKARYHGLVSGAVVPEERFEGGTPRWPLIDRLGDSWTSRIGFGVAYSLFYIAFAPHWAWFALLPIHFVMGPVHGAIVNWCGHKYGYRNFESSGDKSRNTLLFDFVTMGELFQNNHHRYGQAPNFAVRWFELDPTYPVIQLLTFLRIVERNPREQRGRSPRAKATQIAAEPVNVLSAAESVPSSARPLPAAPPPG